MLNVVSNSVYVLRDASMMTHLAIFSIQFFLSSLVNSLGYEI